MGNGAFPVIRPDGALLVLFSVYGSLDPSVDAVLAARSVDGGASFEVARRVAPLLTEDPVGVRAPAFVSADVDAAGTVYVTWADCRFSAQCSANGVVLATSRRHDVDAAASCPVRACRRCGRPRRARVAVATGTSGARARLAITAYAVTQAQGCRRCELIDAILVTSANGGRTWQARQRLNAESMQLQWVADTALGRMLGDYVSTSYVGGRPMPVISLADEPQGRVPPGDLLRRHACRRYDVVRHASPRRDSITPMRRHEPATTRCKL